MARSVTNFGVSLSIDGVGIITDKTMPSETTTAITGPFTLDVSNGDGPGQVRERKASFQLTFDTRNQDAMTALLEGAGVTIQLRFGPLLITMTTFFISEVTWSARPGRMSADVLVLGDAQRIKYGSIGYESAPKSSPPTNPFAHQIFRQDATGFMQRDHSYAVYQENNRIGWAWSEELRNDPVWDNDSQYDTARVRDLAREYDLNPFLEFVSAPLLARAWIEERKYGFHVARWGGEPPVSIPPAFVEADKSISYNVEKFPNRYILKRRSYQSSGRTLNDEVSRFHIVETELDLTTDVFSLGNQNVGEKLSLHEMQIIWSQQPRTRWRLSNAAVRLSRWADSSIEARAEAAELVRAIFRTPTPTTTYIPSVTVPMSQTEGGAPYELWGVVDAAKLTINPNDSPQPRAMLSLTLGAGDGLGVGQTRWNQLGSLYWYHYDNPWRTF